MKTKFLFFVLALLLFKGFSQDAIPQNTEKYKDSSTVWQLFKQDATTFVKGVGYEFSRPVHWTEDDYAKMFGMFTGTVILSFADQPTREFFQDIKDDFPGVVRDFGWYFGSPQNYFIVNAGLYGFGLFTKNPKIRHLSLLIITSSVTSGIIQQLTKNAIGRARPYNELGHLEFRPFISDPDFSAFPSGHTVLSVTMAHSIAKQFKNPWVKAGIYTLGSIAPISRMIDDAHWLTDIAFSTALSIIVVDSVDKFLKRNSKENLLKKNKKVSWNLTFTGNQVGFIGTF